MSSSTSTSSLFTPLQFTGISQYSTDFQSILSRATSIAALPMQALQQQQTTIATQETDMSTLGSSVSAVQSALAAIGKLGSGGGLTASSTDSSVVTATNTAGTTAISYSITNVTSLASPASEVSQTYFAHADTTQVSSTGSMQLTVGTTNFPITLASGQNNLNGLVSAINGLNAGVSASVLTTPSGDYLSVSAKAPGSTTLKLADDPSGANKQLLTSQNQGSNTNFQLNGISVSEPNLTVSDLIPGMTLTFSGTTTANPSEAITVGLSSNKTGISSALQTLVSAYNALQTADNGQRGTAAGSLAANNIVYQISQALNSIVQYHGGSGGVAGLANLGISLDQTGQMSFDQNTFDSLSDSQISSALQMFGSSTTGLGGLQQNFTALTDPTTGSIAVQQKQWSASVTRLQNQVTTMTAQVTAMEQTLNQQLQAADAQVANLASQQNILTASITSLDYAAYGYNTSSSTSKTT